MMEADPIDAEYSWANHSLFAELNCIKWLILGHELVILYNLIPQIMND